MKKISQLVALSFIVAIIFSSCSISKRLYMKGYHVERIGKKQAVQNETIVIHAKKNKSNPVVVAETNKIDEQIVSNSFKNEVVVSDYSGQLNVEKSNKVFFTQKKNKEVEATNFNERKTASVEKKNTLITKKSALQGKDGDQIIALLLCFFFGLLGIHRFYLGYPLMGILYILTLGFIGFGVLIDFFLIAFGILKRK